MGRWLSPDWSAAPEPVPYAHLSDPQSLNLYGYVRNRPKFSVDKDGHFPWLALAGGGGILTEESPLIAVGPVGWAAIAATAAVITYEYFKEGNKASSSNSEQPSSSRSSKANTPAQAAASPNPNGRKGGKAHQNKIKQVEKEMKDRGLDTEREYQVKTPGGEKSSRFVDVVGKDPKKGEVVEMHQVGKQTQAGNPVAREVRALNDVQNASGTRPQFHPYNGPPQ